MDFFDRLLTCLETRYPQACREYNPRENLHRLLICPEAIDLPRALANEARQIVSAFQELREDKARDERLSALAPVTPDPGNFSALMSYDFHIDAEGALRLIEINTNASLSLVTDCLYEVHSLENGFSSSFKKEIIETFEAEAALAGRGTGPLEIAVIDTDPEKQRLYFEFLLFQELFKLSGHGARIADTNQLVCDGGVLQLDAKKIDLVYNRDTDFYFETHPELRRAMLEKCAAFSPHPHEYRLLADKERLLELSTPNVLESAPISANARAAISKTLIRTWDIRSFANPDELWAQRKKLFFKPMRSFGGKATYRGSTITRAHFTKLVQQDHYVAQEFVPAPTVQLKSRPNEEPFKFDLRFYAYRDRVQLACARVYRGQMTNAQTPGGGVAAINWN